VSGGLFIITFSITK